jgi:hypothetical protein
MNEKINWSFNVQVAGGPRISQSSIIDVDAYDKFDISLDKTTVDRTVEVQPGTADNIKFVVITSDNYEAITCKVDPNATTKGPVFKLDGPLILIGSGASSLLGQGQKQLEFVNASSKAASVSIMIGRAAAI